MNLGSTIGRKNSVEIAIDIGSHSLKGVIFEPSPKAGGQPKIFDKKILKLPVFSEPNETEVDLLNRPLTKLQEFVQELVKEASRPAKITLGFGSNLADLSVKDWDTQVGGFSKNLTSVELRGYFENSKKQNLGQNPNVWAFLLETKLNGYRLNAASIRKPKVSDLQFRVLLAELREPVQKIFTDITKSLGGIKIEFLPLIIPQLAVLEKTGIHNAFCLDIGGEETVVFLIKESALQGVKSFPMAGRHFIRGISKVAGISFEEAEDLKRQHSQGLADSDRKAQIHDFLKQESSAWKKNLLDNMESFYHLGPIPVQVLIFGGGGNLPEILSIIRSGEWLKNYSYAEFPKVNVLRGDTIFSGDSLGGFIQGADDFSLASLISYI